MLQLLAPAFLPLPCLVPGPLLGASDQLPGALESRSGSVETLRFRPPVDRTLARTLTVTRATRGAELSVWMDGGPVPAAFLPRIEMDLTETVRVELLDRFLGEAGAPPTGLLRTFERVEQDSGGSMSMSGEPLDVSGSSSSPLEGATVLWSWDDGRVGAGEASATAVDPETLAPLPRELPEGLLEDLDLRGLLPAEGGSQPDTWTVDATALAALLHPLGELGFPAAADEPPADDVQRAWEGELACERVEEAEGLIGIAFEGDLVCRTTCTTDLSTVPITDGDASEVETLTLAVEGRLVWDPELGLVRSASLDATYDCETRTTKLEGQPGPAYEGLFGTEGEIEVRLTVDPR